MWNPVRWIHFNNLDSSVQPPASAFQKDSTVPIQGFLNSSMMKQSSDPASALHARAATWNLPINSLDYARRLDSEDELAPFRSRFSIPKKASLPHVDKSTTPEGDCLYFSGHSLGLKPKATDIVARRILDDWGELGFDANFHGHCPMSQGDQRGKLVLGKLIGAKESEVVVMNSLSVNIHLLLATFYRPTADKYKIVIEDHAFPTDLLAVQSHLRLHGRNPETDLIVIRPKEGHNLIHEEDVVTVLDTYGPSIALVLFPGIQYYTGQYFDLKTLVAAAHKHGIIFGADLAHAVGNVQLSVHDWGVDFGAWCTYKYLNSGPGGVGAIFVHEKHLATASSEGGVSVDTMPMLKGWWGSRETARFLKQGTGLDDAMGADMFRLSTPHAMLNGMLWASLQVIDEAGLERMTRKQFLLTGFLEYLIQHTFQGPGSSEPILKIITPSDPKARGCQLSLMFTRSLEVVQEKLQKRGIVCDVRMPNVIRVAPIPLYNSYEDVYRFVINLAEICKEVISSH